MRLKPARFLICLSGLSLLLAALVSVPAMRPAAAASVDIRQAVTGNVFVKGERPTFRIETSSQQIAWTVRDYWGSKIAAGTTPIDSAESRLELPVRTSGYYVLRVTIGHGEQTQEAQTTFAMLPKPTAPNDDGFDFGMQTHFSHGWSPKIIPLLQRIGVESVRDQQTWQEIEKTPGRYDFDAMNGRYQNYMDALDTTDIEVLAQFGLANDNYDNGATPHTELGRKAYARFVQAVLRHYGDQIQEVAVYNEPNLPKFGDHGDGPADATPQNYAALLKETYRAVKEIRPDVEVGGPEMAAGFSNEGKWDPWLEEFLALDTLPKLDSMSIHPYRDRCCAPEGLAQDLRRLRQVLGEYHGGADKPLWITEQGWTTSLVSERKQAKYLTRTYVLGMKEVDRFHWYNFMDHRKAYGLIRDRRSPFGQFTPKPAYVAYGVLASELSGKEYQSTDDVPMGIQSAKFVGDGTTRVMWAPNEHRTASLSTSEPVEVTDMMGKTRTLEPVDGKVVLTLSGDPMYVSGPIDDIKRGSPFGMDGEQSAVSDPVPAKLTLDNSNSSVPSATFRVSGDEYHLSAPNGGKDSERISVPSGGGAGSRVLRAQVSVGGKLNALLAKDVRLFDDIRVRMLPAIPEEGSRRSAGMRVEVTNNRETTDYHVSQVDWRVGGGKGTDPVDVTVPASSTKVVPVKLPQKDYWKQYTSVASVHMDGIAPVRRTGSIGFNPAAPMSLNVDGTLEELQDTPRMRLTEHGNVKRTAAGIPYEGPKDLGGPMWFAADEKYLYIAAKVKDDVHYNDQTGRGLKNGDSILFGLAKGMPGDTKDFYQYAMALTPNGPKVRRQLAPIDEDTGPAEDAKIAVRRNDERDKTVYELALPWKDLKQLDYEDPVFSLTALTMDNDGDDIVDREGWIEWGSGIGAGKDPALFRPVAVAGR